MNGGESFLIAKDVLQVVEAMSKQQPTQGNNSILINTQENINSTDQTKVGNSPAFGMTKPNFGLLQGNQFPNNGVIVELDQ